MTEEESLEKLKHAIIKGDSEKAILFANESINVVRTFYKKFYFLIFDSYLFY